MNNEYTLQQVLNVTRAGNEQAHNPKPIFAACSNLRDASTTIDVITAPIRPMPNSRQMYSPTKPYVTNNLHICNLLLDRYQLSNGLTAGDKIWHVHSVTPADENRLCPMSIRVLSKVTKGRKSPLISINAMALMRS